MKILVAGGTGFLGSTLRSSLKASGHDVWILTRRQPRAADEVRWDGRATGEWVSRLSETDAVVNATGYGLEHWPWSAARKRRFLDSRVLPATALVQGIQTAQRKPAVFLQISGINYYGARGDGIADESWLPADDYLAQLTVAWETASKPVEALGMRRIIARTAVVLDTRGGLFPLMALPVKLGFGGPLGNGRQAVPWIHIQDQAAAMRFLLERQDATGPFNLIAPQPTSNAEFMRAIARVTHRPYWLPTPAVLLRGLLGEMSTLVVDGRYSAPRRLSELGFEFRFPTIDAALKDLFRSRAS